MTELIKLISPFFIGMGIGFLFLGGLWLTLGLIQKAKWPALWIVLSYWIRLFLILFSFIWIIKKWHWQGLLACLLGFVLMRLIITSKVKYKPQNVKKE